MKLMSTFKLAIAFYMRLMMNSFRFVRMMILVWFLVILYDFLSVNFKKVGLHIFFLLIYMLNMVIF